MMTTAHTDGADSAANNDHTVLLTRGPYNGRYDAGVWIVRGSYNADSGELREVIFSRADNNRRKTVRITQREFQIISDMDPDANYHLTLHLDARTNHEREDGRATGAAIVAYAKRMRCYGDAVYICLDCDPADFDVAPHAAAFWAELPLYYRN